MKQDIKTAQSGVESIAKYTLWGLAAISLIIVACFVLIGYSTPWEEDPTKVSPQFLDALLCWTYFLIAAAAVVSVASVVMGLVSGAGKSRIKEIGMLAHTNLIAWGTFVAAVVIGVAVGVANKSEIMTINGTAWNSEGEHAMDIIMTDTSMLSIVILTVATIAALVFGMVISYAKK